MAEKQGEFCEFSPIRYITLMYTRTLHPKFSLLWLQPTYVYTDSIPQFYFIMITAEKNGVNLVNSVQ